MVVLIGFHRSAILLLYCLSDSEQDLMVAISLSFHL